MDDAHGSLGLFDVAWRLGATLFFVLLNGFFVAAEFALVKVRASRIEDLAKQGQRSAATVQHILANLDRYLSACQLGITLASLVLGALGEPAVSVLLIAAAGGLGFQVSDESSWVPFVSIALAFAVITTLHMTVGEQAPKMWALKRAEGTALRTAMVLRVFSWIFGPFIVAVNGISNGLLRLAGLPVDAHEQSHSTEEIRSILTLSAHAGQISEREYELTHNVFRMIDLEVRHIVVPRVDVEFLSLQQDAEENLALIRRTGHSRLPLCEVGLDTIIGFVHSKDVLSLDPSTLGDLRSLAREAIVVPDTMALSDFLVELQKKRQHCAVVVDEHGTAIGLGFLEDALEEIVGPLGDEFDEREFAFRRLPNGAVELSGRMTPPELCDRLDFILPPEEHEEEETVGGHLTARLGRLPEQGDSIDVGPYRATVLTMAGHRVDRIRLVPRPDPEAEAEPPPGTGE